MYMQIRRYQVKSGTAEELCQMALRELTPTLRQLPGFINYMAIDSGDGKVFSVTIFQNKAGADEAHRKAMEWSQSRVPNRLANPQVFGGEVTSEEDAMRNIRRAA